ncbi:ankyrin repeat-containing domain protein [Dunaliella salina]|uniref:Ankyrin repeat-containing domain protein n=1 Tax=Dunaliella salina TaxID=3046 RepID=A0ABQ7GB53_DUNSA|nr:ankyrin repeat-containing domain protein [Dunaliella salina]|eukprot:KAF5831842.1 ankyrin repeat-containing domain protein [Dunaliella salina]
MALMQNKNAIARIQELRNDPEMEPFWNDVRAGGMQAMMKYYNDPAFLEMIGRKLGDVIPSGASGGAGGGAAATAAPPMAEVTDLLSAARVGDDEAVEDFLAVGKDVGMKDAQSRTPLHFAAGYNHKSIAKMLIEAGAPLEAQDSMGNTPLLYASGYGRAELVELLIAAGASKEAANTNGKTAYALATADARNPLSKNQKILEMLKL